MKFTKIAMMAAAGFIAFGMGVAQAQDRGGVKVMSSTNDKGVQIQGNTNINVNAQDVNTIAAGKGNKAGTSIGTIHGGSQIQGNTNINVNAKNVNTIATGKGNVACTEIGSIGDNPACKK